jgi:alpha-tubulin suppressor-like RCC1 family protein
MPTSKTTSWVVLIFLVAGCSDSAEPPFDTDQLPPPLPLVSISASSYSTCGTGVDFQAYCWGTGREGQLGAAAPENCSDIPDEAPCSSFPLASAESVAEVHAGGQHACALRSTGMVLCWGDGTYGQLGVVPPSSDCSPTSTGCAFTPIGVPLQSPAEILSAGGSHNCVLDTDGAASCWGYNQAGRLGTGDQTMRFTPTQVMTDLRFIAIAAGGTHTCAVAADGRAYCWGNNYLGQLGDGTIKAAILPQEVATEHRFISVSTGIAHTCAVSTTGQGYCWGAAYEGQLGTDAELVTCESYPCSTVPVLVAGEHTFTSLSAGTFTCGVAVDGSYCWGAQPTGDTTHVPAAARTAGHSGESFTQISVGYDHACGVTAKSEAYCWGSDYEGKLGDGPESGGPLPVMVRTAPADWNTSATAK